MPRRRFSRSSSYGQVRTHLDAITDRHTQSMLAKARTRARAGVADPAKIAERRALLESLGLLPGLEQGIEFEVTLPGGAIGTATGITTDALVVIKGWKDPFNPKAIKKK